MYFFLVYNRRCKGGVSVVGFLVLENGFTRERPGRGFLLVEGGKKK